MTRLFLRPSHLEMPVEAIAGEAAIASERLNPAWLRQRFAHPAPWEPETTGDAQCDGGGVPAAVLVPIVVRDEGLTVLLTQRTAHLTDHGGQISFPGGRAEPSDASAIATALRETEEEVGLARRHIDVLGLLPNYSTVTGYQVTPVVSIVQPPFALQADATEVAEIFEVPLAFLMNGMNHQRRSVEFTSGGRRTFYAMPYGRFFIWGATAGMLRNLFHFLRA